MRPFLCIAASSLFTHYIFNRHEPITPQPVLATIFAVPTLWSILFLSHFASPLSTILFSFATYFFVLALSIASYRLSPFHPLASFPGTTISKLTKWWGVWETYEGRHYIRVHELHKKHGPIVRVGPNELSIADVAAIPAVLGSTGLPKGHWYGSRQDLRASKNLQVLNGDAHANRRRLWNRGLSSDSIESYSDIIETRAAQLIDCLERQPGKICLSSFFSRFAFDFLGDMAFGGGFELLRDGDTQHLNEIVDNGVIVSNIISQIPWVTSLMHLVPSWCNDALALRDLGYNKANERLSRGSIVKDLYYHLADDGRLERQSPSVADVLSDGTLAIVAGTDTIKTTLSAVFYHLLLNPTCYQHLQDEVDRVFPNPDDPMDFNKLTEMEYLDACINETLRVMPSVPTNGSRRIPRGHGPRTIAGSVIPEETEIFVSPYPLHRDPRYFSPEPESFLPERWVQSPSFIPFSYGPHNCVGRQIAYRQLRYVVCLMMRRFTVQFASGFCPREWIEKACDRLVLSTDPLPVVLDPRKKSA
ncbi:high nitrogen upregulated cytochrome P450 monooxygenase 2 [Thelephora terrestris]|uniref:High nitrogen upregulated cytochrome P450 monooxygenase 2 n=1 Tax=Thelephora terrestris TaxID=56493 RepID=A0A9P6HHJ3_9AGAM|nr:high nitrogen upregulated cytochrome P450 monooxygenase 2 [Thelephora terrestris]